MCAKSTVSWSNGEIKRVVSVSEWLFGGQLVSRASCSQEWEMFVKLVEEVEESSSSSNIGVTRASNSMALHSGYCSPGGDRDGGGNCPAVGTPVWPTQASLLPTTSHYNI